jgi:hypothetical protein
VTEGEHPAPPDRPAAHGGQPTLAARADHVRHRDQGEDGTGREARPRPRPFCR